MKKRFLKSMLRILGAVTVAVLIGGGCLSQPTFRHGEPSSIDLGPDRLKVHVGMLSETFHPRNSEHVANLERCADYITTQFSHAGAAVESQPFDARGNSYRNVIGRFGVGRGSKIVVGAHYDSCGDTPGADDNASGVAALIELAYLLGQQPPEREIELVAYTLEEPPFFRSRLMGSAVHAKSIAGDPLVGVIVLEMVGCFSDERGSQAYPSALLRLTYPSRGNFIAVVGRWDQGDWIKAVKVGMKGTTDLPVYSLRAPTSVPGVDFSDHINYWPYGYNALMVTDTAFYRNKTYHTREDTKDRLDYDRMSQVVVAVYEALRVL